jgi:hypothetical protein
MMMLACSLFIFIQWVVVAHTQLLWYRCILSPLIVIWLLIVLVSILGLISFHINLIIQAKTTNEFLKPLKTDTYTSPMHKISYLYTTSTLLKPMWVHENESDEV